MIAYYHSKTGGRIHNFHCFIKHICPKKGLSKKTYLHLKAHSGIFIQSMNYFSLILKNQLGLRITLRRKRFTHEEKLNLRDNAN